MAPKARRQDTALPGLRLRELREDAGLSRDTLAFRAGTTAETILQIELHGQEPRYWTAFRIAQVLGVTMEQLAGELPKAESVVVEVFPRRQSSSVSASSTQSQQELEEPAAKARSNFNQTAKKKAKSSRDSAGNGCIPYIWPDQLEDEAA